MRSRLFGTQKRNFQRRTAAQVRVPTRRFVAERLEDRYLLAVLFEHGASDPVQVLVPLEADYDDLGFDWTGLAEPFDDSSWTTVSGMPNGVGYDRGIGAYDPAIGLDVESTMYEASTTLFARAEFDVDDPSLVNRLTLNLRYDDGFLAWLNGAEVARANVVSPYPAWDARATSEYEAPSTPVEFDLSAYVAQLRTGANVLAVRLLNDSPTGDDALLQFTLTGESREGPPLAVDDAVDTQEGQAITIDVLANDREGSASINPSSVAIAAPPAHGMAMVNANGTITYTPNAIYNGPDSFTYTVRDNSGTGQPTTQTLLASNAPVKSLVPTSNAIGNSWRGSPANEPFNDSSWQAGTFGVGYDQTTSPVDFNPNISHNVQSMRNVNRTVYMRSTFSLSDPQAVTALTLRMRYDDGFTAFLNGVQIATGNAPTSLAFDSGAATGDRTDAQATQFESFNATPFLTALRAGTNVLAIHGLNQSLESSDLLMQPELTAVVNTLGRISNSATVAVNVIGVDFAPVAVDDAYQVGEGQTLEASSLGGDDIILGSGQFAWPIAEGGNGHVYQRILQAGNWSDARNSAANLSLAGTFGHLATITSAAEWNFIKAHIPGDAFTWLGGFQDHAAPNYSEPNGGWAWITGEPWSFSYWGPGEPNGGPSEDHLVTHPSLVPGDPYRWMDNPSSSVYGSLLVEYPTAVVGSPLESLIPAGSNWRYRDNGQLPPADAQGNSWKELGYNDANWSNGIAQFGYGESDEATVVSFGPSANDKYVTTWFRKQFTLSADTLTSAESLELGLMADDGASVYINGVEVTRVNLPGVLGDDSITSSTRALAAIEAASLQEFIVDLTLPGYQHLLRPGDNVVAVEIHQSDADTSDLSFDLQLNARLRTNSGVLVNDTELDGQTLTAVLESSPANGTLHFESNGTFEYVPNQGFVGTDTFTYRASDGTLLSDPATVTITVHHTPPTSTSDAYSINEDTPLIVAVEQGVLVNDLDTQDHPLSAILVSPPAHGVLTLNSNGSFTYTPQSDFHGVDSFSYHATDGIIASEVATATITVSPVNDAPTSQADTYETDAGETLEVGSQVDEPLVLGPNQFVWPLSEGGNGHVYEYVDGSRTWIGARNDSQSRRVLGVPGDLATITSLAELEFFRSIAPIATIYGWLGAAQNTSSPTYSEPAGGWEWVTGEPWAYTNWAIGEPNNANGGESVLLFLEGANGFFWNDGMETALLPHWIEYPTAVVVGPEPKQTFIGRNETWRYRDAIVNGSLYPTDADGDPWREADFNDSAWPLGAALLGFGTINVGPIATTIQSSPPGGALSFTTLFRRSFQVADASQVTRLTFNALFDDGAAVFINGREVLRHNLPGNIGDNNLSTNTQTIGNGNEDSYDVFVVDIGNFPDLLLDGTNVIAVEVHQVGGQSSDLGFDLAVTATLLPDGEARGLLGNDTDADGDEIASVLLVEPSHGTLAFETDGAFTYAPNSGFTGVDQFTYRATDGQLFSEPTTVTIVVKSPTTWPEDLNADGAINAGDVAFLLASYGKTRGAKIIEGDLDGDTRIGVRDAIRLRNAFTPDPSPSAAAAIVARAGDRAVVETGSANLLRADRRVRRGDAVNSAHLTAARDQALAEIDVAPIAVRRMQSIGRRRN